MKMPIRRLFLTLIFNFKKMTTAPTTFSNLQIELLRLYGYGVPEPQLLDIKFMLAHYFAQKATEAMDDSWQKQGTTPADMATWANGHLRREIIH